MGFSAFSLEYAAVRGRVEDRVAVTPYVSYLENMSDVSSEVINTKIIVHFIEPEKCWSTTCA